MTAIPRIASYGEFWPFYLREHANPRTRAWHIAGTGAAVMLLIAAIANYSFGLLIAAGIAGYGPAWMSHALIEKNRPATFRHPLWSLVSDFRVVGAWLTGTLDRELEKAGLQGARKT